jgi:hypothetical protein
LRHGLPFGPQHLQVDLGCGVLCGALRGVVGDERGNVVRQSEVVRRSRCSGAVAGEVLRQAELRIGQQPGVERLRARHAQLARSALSCGLLSTARMASPVASSGLAVSKL